MNPAVVVCPNGNSKNNTPVTAKLFDYTASQNSVMFLSYCI